MFILDSPAGKKNPTTDQGFLHCNRNKFLNRKGFSKTFNDNVAEKIRLVKYRRFLLVRIIALILLSHYHKVEISCKQAI